MARMSGNFLHRQQQRSAAFSVLRLNVGACAGVEQALHDVGVALLRRQVERSLRHRGERVRVGASLELDAHLLNV